MNYLQGTAFTAKRKTRRFFRELLLCAVIIAVLFMIFGRNFTIPLALFGGLLFSPILWLAYRFIRFVARTN